MSPKQEIGVAKVGFLVHVYHLDARSWDALTWGKPEIDSLGSFPTLAEVLLRRMRVDEIDSIVLGSTELQKDGLLHGEYVKKFVLDRFDRLSDFPRLKKLLDTVSDNERKHLRQLFETITMPTIRNTADEIVAAAGLFAKAGVQEVVQIAAASHAPRCTQLQLEARAKGTIPADQMWFVRATDVCFDSATPLSTAIFEPPHRGDDPMIDFRPMLPEVMKQYQYGLSGDDKKRLIAAIEKFMAEHATQDDVRNFSAPK